MSDRRAKPTDKDRATAALLTQLWEDYKQANLDENGKPPTQNVLIERTGLSQSAISQYLNGRLKFGYGAVLKFAAFFDKPPIEIRDDLDALPRDTLEEDWEDIRGVSQAASLGDGSEPDEYAEHHKLKFRSSSLRRKNLKPDSLVVYYGSGDSMLPRIKDGDAVLFDTSDRVPKDGRIYMFSGETGLTVKRIADYGGRWFLEADNKSDPKWRKPVPIDGKRPFQIEGRVRWVGSWED